MSSRIDALQAMLARDPRDGRAHFGLASEFEKLGDWPMAISHLEQYLRLAEDQGNAWGRLARAHLAIGNSAAAAEAYRTGIQAAHKHGHPSMAAEFEASLEQLTE